MKWTESIEVRGHKTARERGCPALVIELPDLWLLIVTAIGNMYGLPEPREPAGEGWVVLFRRVGDRRTPPFTQTAYSCPTWEEAETWYRRIHANPGREVTLTRL